MIKTVVSKQLCISCGLCPSVAPELYKMDVDDKAIAFKSENLSPQEAIDANEAADSCPVNAIMVN